MRDITAEELRGFPVFQNLSASALAVVAAGCSVRDYRAGETVVAHHDTTFDVFLLLSGRAQVNLYSFDGQKVGYHDMAAGVMFGEISAVDGLPRSTSVEARGRCRIAVLPRSRFLAMIEECPGFAVAVSCHLASQVRRLTVRVYEFSTMAVRQRLRAELLRHAVLKEGTGDAAVIDPMPTHAELACRISTHREAVSREMTWLDTNGLAIKRGRSLFIPSLTRLRSLVEDGWDA